MAEHSDAVEEQAVRDGSAAYAVEPEIGTAGDVPPGYKRTEVGVIPDDWGVCELRKLLSAPPSYGINAAATKYEESLPAYLRITDIDSEGRFSPDPPVSVNHTSARDYFLNPGDLVFARTGASVGKSYEYKPSDGRLVYAGFLIRVSPDTRRLDATFLSNFCRTEYYWNWVRSVSLRSGQPGVNGAEYGSLLVPVPPVNEQRAIATALSDADALIESLDRLIAKKRAIKQATMQQLLTGQTRLPGFTGEWETKRLGEFVSIRNQKIMPSSVHPETPCIELEHIGQGDGRLLRSSTAKRSTASKYQFHAGDVLFGRLRSYLRKYWLAEQDGICTTEIWPLMVDSSQAVSGFLLGIVQTDRFNESASISYGTHMPRADWKVMRNFEVGLPSVKEQTAIAAVLSDMDTEIEALERRRDKARQTKQGMMQQLLTGRVRLVTPEVAA